ncbi:MAG: hypothetical protein ACO26G_03465, partial [Rickettsiales bacterium]
MTNYLSLLLCLILLTYSKTSFATAIPFSGTVSVQTSSTNGAKYLQYTKDGVTSNFYTNYLPPKGSYNLSTSFESVLEKCQLTSDMTLNYIGIDCMIAIPPPCPTSINGVTCLNYSNVFRTISSSKNFDPIKCEGGTDGVNCLSTLKPYCHQVDNPILGINCKLPPCNAIPNNVFRRPGVNCMADCNQAPGDSIKYPQLFMEGFNCLRSCSTSSGAIIGANCVLEFNDYVMPLCNDARTPNGQSSQFYNKTSKPNPLIRQDCIDYRDLPICGAGESNASKKCTNRCISDSDTNAGLTCTIPTYLNSFCHNNPNTPGCTKYYCHQLSPNELKQSQNSIMPYERNSNQLGCLTSEYTNFSFQQLANDGSFNNHTVNYTLAAKPCNSPDYLDTETIVKILGSSYYQTTSSGSYPYLQIVINNSLNILGSSNSAVQEMHTPEHQNFVITSIFDRNSLCKFTNISEKIACLDYFAIKDPPFDCNSNGFSAPSSLSSCDDSSPSQNCYCNISGQEYCYKTGINCNKASNQIYSICKTLYQNAADMPPDSSASWFFKPALDPLAIKEVGGVKKLINFTNASSYIPLKSSLTPTEIANPNDNILMSRDTLKANYNSVIGIIWTPTSPGTEDADLGQSPISPEYICGMNNDIRRTPSEDSLYYAGDVQSFYGLDDKIIHQFNVCTRLMSTGAIIGESCGKRRCRANCSGIGSNYFEICTKNCGVDICKQIQVITDASGAMTENCISDEKSFKEQYPYELSKSCTTTRRGRALCTYQKKYPKCTAKLSNNGSALENARIRSFIPDPGNNYICSVLEFRGVTTKHFSPSFFDGDEYFIVPTGNYKSITTTTSGVSRTVTKSLFKKICVSGIYDTSTGECINGFNTNKDEIEINVWRTSRIVRNILQPPNSNGNWDMSLTRDGKTDYFYLNDDGMDYVDQFGSPNVAVESRSPLRPNMSIHRTNYNNKIKYETSDCVKFSLRYPSPIYNNVESRRTAPSLFIPSLLIDDTCFTGGGSAGTPVCDSSPDTDFYTPAIKVIWGNKSSSFALQNSPSSVTNYKIISISYDAEKSTDYVIYLRNAGLTDYTGIEKTVFLKKSFDIEKRPNVCLYEKEVNGTETKESLIGCVPRRRASGATVSSIAPATPANQTLYNQTDFNVKFYHPSYSSFTPNVITIPKLTNLESTFELRKCLGNISNQGYPICIERHECTVLNFECIENERDLIAELNKNPRNEALATTMKKIS